MMRLTGAIIAAGTVAWAAAADTVTLRGSDIPLPNCNVQDIKAGRLYYSDSRGRRQWRELDEIAALGFDDLPELDEAERHFASGASADGVHKLLQALVKVEEELPRLWVHLRLVRAHDSRGEYVQAVGHVAAVFMLREESYWRLIEPICTPNRPDYPAAKETMDRLREAQRALANRDLTSQVAMFIAVVQPIHDELAASYDGPPIAAGSTLSGIPLEQIRSGSFETGAAPPPEDEAPPQPPGDEPPGAEDAPEVEPPAPVAAPAGDSAQAVDALLQTGRSAEALALCRRIAERPGNRSLSRFLYQYGSSLAAENQPRDAAVMFMRCAVLYESSSSGAMSLIEAAAIYRDEYENPRTAGRLLQRAIDAASAQERDDLVERARGMLDALQE